MSIIENLLVQLNESGVRYVHFKSNAHLDDNFTGASDFDLLVDRRDAGAFRQALLAHGLKQFEPTRYGVYPGVENWLAFDADEGVLHHFHVHFQLASGLELYKDYILPWAELILNSRILDGARGCYISDPNLEILLLLARMVIKTPFRGSFRARLGALPVPDGMMMEFRDLLGRTERPKVEAFARRMFRGAGTHALLLQIVDEKDLTARRFVALSARMRAELRAARRCAPMRAHFRSSHLKLKRLLDRQARLEYPMRKKIDGTGGLIIAFVGIDGSGKSTLSRQVQRWLGKKIESRHAYLGSGAEADSRRMRPVRRLARGGKGPFRNALHGMLYAMVAARLARTILRLNRYRLNGGIAVTDRFPQVQRPGVNDGPKLAGYLSSRNPLMRRWAGVESARYAIVQDVQPGLVIRMNISAQTSMQRHPEQTNIQVYEQKIAGLAQILFDRSIVVDVDGEQPLEQVLLEVKRIVWNHL